jgi:hypothetical protein
MYEDSTAVTNPCDALQPCITMQHTCQTHATSVDTCLAVCRSLLSTVDVEDISSRSINDGGEGRGLGLIFVSVLFSSIDCTSSRSVSIMADGMVSCSFFCSLLSSSSA